MRILSGVVGEFSWIPKWLRRFDGRVVVLGLLLGFVAFGFGYAFVSYIEDHGDPTVVTVDVLAPGVTPVVRGDLRPVPLRLTFRHARKPGITVPNALSAARIDLVGAPVESGVDITPSIAGEWRFETGTRLAFRPDEDWPAGTTYRVRFGKALLAPHLTLADNEVEFRTLDFTVKAAGAGFRRTPDESLDPRVVATLRFSHPVERASLEERLRMTMQADGAERHLLAHWIEYGPHDRSASVRSEPVAVPRRGGVAVLDLTGLLVPARGEPPRATPLRVQVRVPGVRRYFRVEEVEAKIVRDVAGNAVQNAVVSLTDQVDTEDFANRVEAWILPRPQDGQRHQPSRNRWRPREVTPEILGDSEGLPVTVNPTSREASDLQSIAFDAPAGRDIYLRIGPGLVSRGGFEMKDGEGFVIRAPDYPTEVRIAQEGALLPLSGKRRLTISARGVDAVKVEIRQIALDAVNHLVSQTGGDITDPWFRNRHFDEDNIAVLHTRIVDINAPSGKRAFASLDLDPYLPRGGLFIIRVLGFDRELDRTTRHSDRRLAIVTDLGLLAKTDTDGRQHIFVHSVATGQPVSGARVELLGKNGWPVLAASTDHRGHAVLPEAAEFQNEREATVYVVRRGEDFAFLPYRRDGRRLSWSGFDVGGERVLPLGEGGDGTYANRVTAALYSDRGLYRPGETIRLFGILRRSDLGSIDGTPLELSVIDPRGGVAFRSRFVSPPDGFEEWSFETRPESPTGRYQAMVSIVSGDDRRHLGRVAFDIEEFQPDRLRIRAAVDNAPEKGWLQPGSNAVEVRLENLFGTPAEASRVRGSLELVPVSPRFREYPGYVFADPFRDPSSPARPVKMDLDEVKTDADGVARLPLDLARYDNGIYRLRASVEGFEAGGGRSVHAVAACLMSPVEALVGYRADGALRWIPRGETRTVRFLAVDSRLSAMPLDGLYAVVEERQYVSALVRKPRGAHAYESVLKEHEIRRQPVVLPTDGLVLHLPTGQPGRYTLSLVDADGRQLARVPFAVAGERNLGANLEQNAELDLRLERTAYAPGEEIVMEVTVPYAGVGLATIERERVFDFKWFRTDSNTALVRMAVPEDLTGNAYVNVAFVRDIASPSVFVSPLSYGVAPFSIDRAASHLEVGLESPALTSPGNELTIGYSTPEPSRILLYAVDEGILQLADYETPDPLGGLLRKKALEVETHQMVDLVLADYDVVRAASAPGGGEAARLIGANLNPFRRRAEPPVALWSGIVESGPEQREVTFDVPDYFNGQLRVMAVAVASSRFGAASARTTVRSPLVLTPNVPLAVAPGDRFDMSVTVANLVEGSGEEAEVSIAATVRNADPGSPGVVVEGATEQVVAVAEGREARAVFKLRAGSLPGPIELAMSARVDTTAAERRVGLSVRPPTPYATTVSAGFAERGNARIDLPRRLYEPFAERQLAVSGSPLVLAQGVLAYVETFPHDCAEQLTSKVFPQVALLETPTVGMDRDAVDSLFRTTTMRLRSRQAEGGGFRLWPSSGTVLPFVSAYVAHLLTDAQDAGLGGAEDMLESALVYLRRVAARREDRLARALGNDATGGENGPPREAMVVAYAIYVLTRNGIVTTNYLTALEDRLDAVYADRWRGDAHECIHGCQPCLATQRARCGTPCRRVPCRSPGTRHVVVRQRPRARRAVRLSCCPALPGSHVVHRRRCVEATRGSTLPESLHDELRRVRHRRARRDALGVGGRRQHGDAAYRGGGAGGAGRRDAVGYRHREGLDSRLRHRREGRVGPSRLLLAE